MFKTIARLAIPMFLIVLIGGCKEEIGSQNPNAPAGGHAEGVHDQGTTGGDAGAAAGGGHAQQ
jgi:hypothetical protein